MVTNDGKAQNMISDLKLLLVCSNRSCLDTALGIPAASGAGTTTTTTAGAGASSAGSSTGDTTG